MLLASARHVVVSRSAATCFVCLSAARALPSSASPIMAATARGRRRTSGWTVAQPDVTRPLRKEMSTDHALGGSPSLSDAARTTLAGPSAKRSTLRSRTLPRGFGQRRRYATARRSYHCDPAAPAYSHSEPIGDWTIPLLRGQGLDQTTCQALATGRKPSVAYTRDVDEAEELLLCIPLGQPLGLDLEWNFNAKTGASYKTALLQICSSSLIVVLQLSAMKRIPGRLRELLSDRETVKTGVAIKADCAKLARDYGVRVNGILELSTVARRAEKAKWAAEGRRGLISLRELCGVYLQRDLVKDETRVSDWTRPLSARQIEYAASDTYAGLEILGKLCGIVDARGVEEGAGVDAEAEAEAEADGSPQAAPSSPSLPPPTPPQKSFLDELDDLALETFLGEPRGPPPPPPSRATKPTTTTSSTTATNITGQSSHEAIVIEDSDQESVEGNMTARKAPLASLEGSARINRAAAQGQEQTVSRRPGWFAKPAAKKSPVANIVASESPSLTLIRSLLYHSDGG